ncbi:MAG: dephospho-CoA kinase [Methanophagales archaeon]|nr:dephospho-CoA kinase [Methanophagales archaeon]RLG34141.1 MAG: dephospho-CoA kinase [Methanosarcinales archaeon]
MRVVGITGGVASGKSLVLSTFMNLGAYGIDCDVLSREVIRPCSKAWWEIVNFFGTGIVRNNLEIDRKKLRDIVFRDSEQRKILERIIHPEVWMRCMERMEAIEKIEANPNVLVVIDVPLLIETGLQKKFEFDKVIVVYVREETQIRRVMEREGITKEEAKKMIGIQMPLKEKLKFADFVINNEGPREETEKQVRKVFEAVSS